MQFQLLDSARVVHTLLLPSLSAMATRVCIRVRSFVSTRRFAHRQRLAPPRAAIPFTSNAQPVFATAMVGDSHCSSLRETQTQPLFPAHPLQPGFFARGDAQQEFSTHTEPPDFLST